MRVTVIPHVDEVRSEQLSRKTVIMIDVFRASSCIVTALAHGASSILPTATVAQARAHKNGRLSGGERFGIKVEGFDMGNSPSEYRSEKVRNRNIVMTTTNGTRALAKASRGQYVLISCFLNGTACATHAIELYRDILLLCAGTRGEFSLEDGMAAGFLLDILRKLNPSVQCDDLGLALIHSYHTCQNHLLESLSASQSGQRLIRRGLQQDIRDCLRRDQYPIVPRLDQTHIVL
ncbi:2-phosphosulfolactate phosphatase [Kroppenstedtia pulmonis]|uniref:Probable 2-phosphosulfolactate phosphatase n=1 Tax=Kroppenstedtia pulmonis TaxID=1380685 RepID=A0A7D3XRE1_9BACL|nr:2-phosphosulfolactate phosphatase [Kroppenstedtia pulmonis]QKG84208.1 2-phosphosulfolactate phosphatase [Kroppenstedtia pulmonis]